jgi:hypothetical protein
MLSRCRNKTNKKYPRYGGRGIRVCDRWKSFKNFLSDMGERPKNHSIDRIDNNVDYTPDNCRWATVKQQANNTSTNIKISYKGKTMTVSEWSDFTGIKYATIWSRHRAGMCLNDVFYVGNIQHRDKLYRKPSKGKTK